VQAPVAVLLRILLLLLEIIRSPHSAVERLAEVLYLRIHGPQRRDSRSNYR
jgi:hypothetical protein